ncbi:MAG: OmpH family outer membrane protein [Nitrospirales bacterium]
MDVQNPSDLPIGVVDPQRILQETIKGQRLSDTLNAFMKDRQALVELEQKELRKLEEELMAQSNSDRKWQAISRKLLI